MKTKKEVLYYGRLLQVILAVLLNGRDGLNILSVEEKKILLESLYDLDFSLAEKVESYFQ